MHQPIDRPFLLHINQSVFVFVLDSQISGKHSCDPVPATQIQFPNGGAEPPTKSSLASTTIAPPFSSSTAWRLDQTTESSAVNDQMNHLAKGGHIDTVAIVPPAHPWSSSPQGGTCKISDPSHDNGSWRKYSSFFVAVITHKMGIC